MPAPHPKVTVDALIAAAKANPDTETAESLGKRFGMHPCTVWRYLKLHKVKLTDKRHFLAKYTVDETFFETIDTPVKAQILGFIYADGTLSPRHRRMSITVSVVDEQYLKTINQLMGHTKPLYHGKTAQLTTRKGKTYTSQPSCSAVFTRRRIYDDLAKIGLCPRKTYVDLPLPPIPDRLIRWFILGLFEGDGCISYHLYRGKKTIPNWCLLGGPTILRQIADHIEHHLGIPHNHHIPRDKNINSLRYSSQAAVNRLMDWLYTEHTGLRMDRKYDKWLEYKRVTEELMSKWTPDQHRNGKRALKSLPPLPHS